VGYESNLDGWSSGLETAVQTRHIPPLLANDMAGPAGGRDRESEKDGSAAVDGFASIPK
jgi:hypothetical protein